MNLKTLSSEGKIAYLIKPILKVLQEAGGQLERSEIKERIADMDDQIAEYSVLEKKSKQTGNTYKAVSYTHLDVYKRQPLWRNNNCNKR